jgi:tryptophanyl-tRNA synthetase
MSKSEASEHHAVYLLDDLKAAHKKIMRAVTDSGRDIGFNDDPERAGVNNLLTIYEALTGQSREQIEEHFDGKGYGDLKRDVADAVVGFLEELQGRYQEVTGDAGYLDSILKHGAERAREVAEVTLRNVKERMGFLMESQLRANA